MIFCACFFYVFAISARVWIHSCRLLVCGGGGGMSVCVCLLSSSIMGWFCQLGVFFVMYIALRIKWYVVRCFFHCFWSFLGRNPPCSDVRGVNVGKGGALQVSSINLDVF